MGLRIYKSSRYTIDLDAVKVVVEKTFNDAVWFRFEKEIDLKTQGEYGGVRQVFRAGIGEIPKNIKKFQIIQFDLGIGDPIVPSPLQIKTPELIGENELTWFVYPIETMIAEKIHALVDLGKYNSRSKDIFDLSYFLPRAEKNNLFRSLEACFNYRETVIPKDLIQHLKTIDLSLLKIGWSSAVSGIKEAPSFEEAYQSFIDELQKFWVS